MRQEETQTREKDTNTPEHTRDVREHLGAC